MSIEKKYIVYTAADIQKYLSGGMSNAEMYAIEKAALDDPFLAEAIEGYEEMEEKDWSKELLALKQQLDVVENTPVAPLYKSSFTKWWKAAAAVLVIGSSVAVAWLFTNKKIDTNDTIASTKTETDSIAVAKTDTAINTTAGTVSPVTIAQNTNTASTAITYADSAKQTLATDVAVAEKRSDDFVYTPPAVPSAESKDVAAGRGRDEEREKVSNESVAINPGAVSNTQGYDLNKNNANNNGLILQNDKATDNYKFQNKVSDNYFNAQVVTPDNKPVAYANVTVPKNSKPVYTDAQGNFKLAAADSTVNVVVTSAGYTPQKFRLQNSAAQNKIVLQPSDIAVKEISAGKKKAAVKAELKKEAINAEMDEEDDEAEPSGGWVEYNSYLSNNLVFPNEAKQKNIHGEVEVFVKLKSNGDISKVKVGKPLCDECDAEAIRLVKEGPKWEVKKNKASKVKIKIKF